MPGRNDFTALAATAALVFALDQATKAAVLMTIGPSTSQRSIKLAGDWLALEYAENRGVAFGLLSDAGSWLALVAIIVLAALLAHYATTTKPEPWETVAIGAIVGGAAGNLFDRLRLGYVVDFLAVGAWPNFNVADSAITVGAILLLWGWLLPHNARAGSGTSNQGHDENRAGARAGRQRAR